MGALRVVNDQYDVVDVEVLGVSITIMRTDSGVIVVVFRGDVSEREDDQDPEGFVSVDLEQGGDPSEKA